MHQALILVLIAASQSAIANKEGNSAEPASLSAELLVKELIAERQSLKTGHFKAIQRIHHLKDPTYANHYSRWWYEYEVWFTATEKRIDKTFAAMEKSSGKTLRGSNTLILSKSGDYIHVPAESRLDVPVIIDKLELLNTRKSSYTVEQSTNIAPHLIGISAFHFPFPNASYGPMDVFEAFQRGDATVTASGQAAMRITVDFEADEGRPIHCEWEIHTQPAYSVRSAIISGPTSEYSIDVTSREWQPGAFYPKVVEFRHTSAGELIEHETLEILQGEFNEEIPADIFSLDKLNIAAGRSVRRYGTDHLVWDGKKLTSNPEFAHQPTSVKKPLQPKGDGVGWRETIFIGNAVLIAFLLVWFVARNFRRS